MTCSVETVSARIPTGVDHIAGELVLPEGARAVVLFAHGFGSGRHSPRNRHVAGVLEKAGLATLLVDLLTPEEERVDLLTLEHRFDVGLLAQRLLGAIDWLREESPARALPLGLFGASTGAAAALVAAAMRPAEVGAVVSRGGRPDLAVGALGRVRAPTLLIVGSNDAAVIPLNRSALRLLGGTAQLELVAEATHLFEEPGVLDIVAELSRDWFTRHLAPPADG